MSKDLSQKTLWVTSVSPREVDGASYIPTALCYETKFKPTVGRAAVALSDNNSLLNSNFKIDLGDVNPGVTGGRKQFDTGSGRKTAYELSKDYIDGVLSSVEDELIHNKSIGTKVGVPAKIVVAEPLSFQVEGRSSSWLPNYRENLRRILSRYEKVEFLPEPFAVYQYYRYGLRVPGLLDRGKHIALILDFGGGTFDACVIESTHQGDISQTGKHSKPLSANSIPIGGFYVNRRIALYLIKSRLEGNDKKNADTYFNQYERVLKNDDSLTKGVLKTECQNFISNLEELERRVEDYKIDLVSKISSWDLSAEAYERTVVSLPVHPFRIGSWTDSELYAHQFRQIFEEIWATKINSIVSKVLKVAEDGLQGRSITTTLISGGSSNIRWLEKLITRDFPNELANAAPIPISHSFQEIVANGLAIECARRFYSEDTEFVSVTYNPVRLHLACDGSEIETKYRYRSIDDRIEMKGARPGDLVPTAQSLRHFYDQHLQWRIKLHSPPKRYLEYYFCRPRGDGEASKTGLNRELDSDVYNIEETTVQTRRKNFDSHIVVDLQVQSDGTTTPKFIYKRENALGGVSENSEQGRPFYIDMTTDSESNMIGSNFVGFDFGTSNSAICTLTHQQIDMTKNREDSDSWRGISDSLPELPYPVAIAVRHFLGCHTASETATSAREAFEAGIMFMAYVAAAEACSLGMIGKILSNFQHRSLGPLWNLLKTCVKKLGDKSQFSKAYRKIVLDDADIVRAIRDFNDNKHQKLRANTRDWQKYVRLPLFVLSESLKGKKFVYSIDDRVMPFSRERYEGIFVVAHDNAPFIETVRYESNSSIAGPEALLIDCASGEAISLSPFIFWNKDDHADHPSCYVLDRFSTPDNNGPIVRPCDRECSILAKKIHPSLPDALGKLESSGEGGRRLKVTIKDREET